MIVIVAHFPRVGLGDALLYLAVTFMAAGVLRLWAWWRHRRSVG